MAQEHAERAALLEAQATRRAAEGRAPLVVDLFAQAHRERQLGQAAKAVAEGIRF